MSITETRKFSADDFQGVLKRLFDRYSTTWLPLSGAGGLRIVALEGE